MQSEILHQNSQSFYPLEPFTLDHITMRHPVVEKLFKAAVQQKVNSLKQTPKFPFFVICDQLHVTVTKLQKWQIVDMYFFH